MTDHALKTASTPLRARMQAKRLYQPGNLISGQPQLRGLPNPLPELETGPSRNRQDDLQVPLVGPGLAEQ
jgi:hypothetical protein